MTPSNPINNPSKSGDGKIIKTDRLHRWTWIITHPVKWHQTKPVRTAVDEALKRLDELK